jgi:hypothetical protein
MSLLDRGTETVKVFQAQTPEGDSDCNIHTRAAKIGTMYRAAVQPISSTENAEDGFNTTGNYRLRLIGYPGILGAQSQVEWRGKR